MNYKELTKLIKKTRKSDTTYVHLNLSKEIVDKLREEGYRCYQNVPNSDKWFVSWKDMK